MKIEFETDEMTYGEMGAVRKLLETLMYEAIQLERDNYDDDKPDMTLDFPGRGGDKK